MAFIASGTQDWISPGYHFTETDRQYVNAFVFSRGGDPPPPTSFMSDAERVAYESEREYRIMSTLRVGYGGGNVEILGQNAVAGLTRHPARARDSRGSASRRLHPNNRFHTIRQGRAFLLNEARVGRVALGPGCESQRRSRRA